MPWILRRKLIFELEGRALAPCHFFHSDACSVKVAACPRLHRDLEGQFSVVSCPRNHQERTAVSRSGGGGRFLLGEGQDLRKRAGGTAARMATAATARRYSPRSTRKRERPHHARCESRAILTVVPAEDREINLI